MQALERNRLAKTIFIAAMAFLCFWIICGSGVEAKENGLKDLLLENFEDSPEVKKTKDGFYYTMDSDAVMEQFRKYFPKKNSSQYRKYEKLYGRKKNCCYLLCYLGKKKNIRLPEQIEGVSDYVLCVSLLNGWDFQVKNVTIPKNVRISAVMYDNPYLFIDIKASSYNENRSFLNTYTVEKGNTTVKSKNGLLYSKDGKILHGISGCIKGKMVIPDSVEEVHISDYLCVSDLVFGKNVSKISINMLCQCNAKGPLHLKKIRVKQENSHFKVIDNIMYSKDMKHIYFSIPGKKGTYKMPDTVEEMDEQAFVYTFYSKMITSNKLKSLPALSLSSDYLTELEIGKSVSKISKTTVESSQIKKLTLNKNNKYFVIEGNYLYDKNMKKKYIYINN